MTRFNSYMNNGFQACRLLAYARDQHRERDVRIYVVPGFTDCVGITDGIDNWIAPVAADCFSVNVARLMDDLRAGKVITPEPLAPKRRRVVLIDDDPPPRSRVQLEPEVSARRRHVIFS